jgi:hypothetical protein
MTRQPRRGIPWSRYSFQAAAILFFLAIQIVCGCGTPAAPLAPTLKLPQLVKDLTGTRSANSVRLKWTVPRRSTDNILLEGPVEVYIWRATEAGKRELVGDVKLEPGAASEFADRLPAQLLSGTPVLLTYTVELLNHTGHSAGMSNATYASSGPCPPPMTDFSASYERDGVLLQWKPDDMQETASIVRISRQLLDHPSKGSSASSIQAPPQEEALVTLLVTPHGGKDAGKALDKTALPARHYEYRAERLMRVDSGGHVTETEGASSGQVRVETKDVFPPAPPQQLAAVADPGQGSIDLSWSANTESDMAGYVVYRHEADGKPVRISPGDALVIAPSFRDSTAQSGHNYFYSVSAIDTSGNESPRSAESKETLPQ